MTRHSILQAHAESLLRASILGFSFTVVGLMTHGLPPLLLTGARFIIAALILLPLAWREQDRLPHGQEFICYVALGLCQAIFFAVMFWAMHRISALSMAALYVSIPFLTCCLSLALRLEQTSIRLFGILAMGAVGAFGLAWVENGIRGSLLKLGADEAIFFVGCIALAIYTVLTKWALIRNRISISAQIRTFWILAIGAAFVTVAGLINENPQDLLALTSSDVLWLIYLGVFSTSGTFWLLQRVTAVLSPTVVTAYSYVPPFISMLVLFITEPENISWRWAPGSFLIILTVALLIRRGVTAKT